MRKIAIFGAGEWGKIAYHYYKGISEIVCYIDNDKRIWDTQVNGVPVCSPDILKDNKYTVVIANKRFEKEIKKQLLNEYNIREVIVFRIEEKMQELYDDTIEHSKTKELIVAFSHGLGNQMFQYALYRNFLKQGKEVKADLSAYIKPDMMPFELTNFFPDLQLKRCKPWEKEIFLKEENVYIEEPPRNEEKTTFREELLNWEDGYIEGFHCSYRYPDLIREELLKDFEFSYQCEEKLCELKTLFEEKNIVGVHIRRGDFLNPKYRREFGTFGINEYYNEAIEYIKKKYPEALFCFFSNDMQWVKDNIKEDNSMYIEENMFQNYQDWYDMYLMSICKHNIIPNSTFGWWGAWLNQNPDKVVIAPKIWRNRWDARDWCPPEWILL